MSINPAKTAPYSEDIRWRIIWQKEALKMNLVTVASNLGVDPSTVSRIVKLFHTNGDVCKRPYPKNARPNKKLTCPVELTILHTILLQHPEIYLDEVQKEVCILTGVYLSTSSICAFLKKTNFTRQKMQLVAQQQIMNSENSFLLILPSISLKCAFFY